MNYEICEFVLNIAVCRDDKLMEEGVIMGDTCHLQTT